MNKKFVKIMACLLLALIFAVAATACDDAPKNKIGEVSVTIDCRTILDNMEKVEQGLLDNNIIPVSGVILGKTNVDIFEGDSAYDALARVCKQHKIQLDSDYDPIFRTHYVTGINYIYEMSVGGSSGWMYFVDGQQPDVGISNFALNGGEEIVVAFTCVVGDLQWLG